MYIITIYYPNAVIIKINFYYIQTPKGENESLKFTNQYKLKMQMYTYVIKICITKTMKTKINPSKPV